jgi:hypothetical protein
MYPLEIITVVSELVVAFVLSGKLVPTVFLVRMLGGRKNSNRHVIVSPLMVIKLTWVAMFPEIWSS